MREVWQGKYADAYRDLDHSFIPITFFFPDFPNPMRSKVRAAGRCFTWRQNGRWVIAQPCTRRPRSVRK